MPACPCIISIASMSIEAVYSYPAPRAPQQVLNIVTDRR